MPAKNYWDNPEKTVYVVEAIAPSTWEEAREAFMHAFEAIAPLDQPVIIMLDATNDPNPPSPQVMTEFRRILVSAPENVTGLVLVGANQLATKMVNTLGRVLGKLKLSAATDRAEADERIRQMLKV